MPRAREHDVHDEMGPDRPIGQRGDTVWRQLGKTNCARLKKMTADEVSKQAFSANTDEDCSDKSKGARA